MGGKIRRRRLLVLVCKSGLQGTRTRACPRTSTHALPGRRGEQRKSRDATLRGFQILNRGVRLGAFIVEQTSHEYFIVLVEE